MMRFTMRLRWNVWGKENSVGVRECLLVGANAPEVEVNDIHGELEVNPPASVVVPAFFC